MLDHFKSKFPSCEQAVAHACYSSICLAEAGGSRVPGFSGVNRQTPPISKAKQKRKRKEVLNFFTAKRTSKEIFKQHLFMVILVMHTK